ncbi:MAG: hypothetical protein JXX28_03420 [Deltaproteobacteria bacterium]|nr:hypothetical protein [Deltaproteobacteria bacterium]
MLILALLLSCGTPDPCDATCEAGESLLARCGTWEEGGFDDRADFIERCATWSWELRLLEAEALQSGVLQRRGAVDATCRERTELLTSDQADCESWASLEWSTAPWER